MALTLSRTSVGVLRRTAALATSTSRSMSSGGGFDHHKGKQGIYSFSICFAELVKRLRVLK